jgi:urease accessory protein
MEVTSLVLATSLLSANVAEHRGHYASAAAPPVLISVFPKVIPLRHCYIRRADRGYTHMRERLLGQRAICRSIVLSLAAALVPMTGYAHPGDVTTAGFLAGFLHPWTGPDHVAAMLAVGIWATLMRNRPIAALLGASAVGIVAGTSLSAYTDILTGAEQITVVSVIVIGVLATAAGQSRVPLAASLVSVLCFFHGYVHALETPRQFSQLAFSSGFLTSMLALQLLGVVIAASLSRRTTTVRSAGACCVAVGLALLLTG